jgi:hypothetical protein
MNLSTPEKLLYILKPLEFLEAWRGVTWTLACVALLWLVGRRVFGIHSFAVPSLVLWWLLIAAGSVQALCLIGWILLLPKGHQGLSLVAGFISSLPILLPAVAATLFYPATK